MRLSAEQADAVIAAITAALAEAELTADELMSAIVARTGAGGGEPTMPAFGGMWPRSILTFAVAAAAQHLPVTWHHAFVAA